MSDDNTPEEVALVERINACTTIEQLETLAPEHTALPRHPSKGKHGACVGYCPIVYATFRRKYDLQLTSIQTMTAYQLLMFLHENGYITDVMPDDFDAAIASRIQQLKEG